MPRPFRLAVLLALPIAVAACADLNLDGDDDRRDRRGGSGFGFGQRSVEFRCDNDRQFEVSFRDGGDEAVVRTRDESYRLRYEGRDGGARQYGDGDVRLTVDGDEARLRIKDERDYTDCEQR